MSFRIRIDPVAQSEIDHFTAYLGAYDEEFAIEQIERLDRIFYMSLVNLPRRPSASTALVTPRPGLTRDEICHLKWNIIFLSRWFWSVAVDNFSEFSLM